MGVVRVDAVGGKARGFQVGIAAQPESGGFIVRIHDHIIGVFLQDPHIAQEIAQTAAAHIDIVKNAAHLVAMGINLERINGVAEQLQQEIREQYNEPDAIVRGDDVDALGGNALSTQDSAKVVTLLCSAPNGIQAMSKSMPGLVQTSLNMGIAKLDDNLQLTFSVRSSVNSEKEELIQQLKDLAAFHEADYSQMGDYPAWEYREESPLRDLMVAKYTEMFGQAPQVLAIHAGLECGLLGDKLPGLDAISVGPQLHDVHTSRETMEFESVKRTWDYLLEVLKAL